MYRFLLAWRYLRTRYIALASIVSVTLGVGTLIVVNSVMAGFTREMHIRLHSILADIVFETIVPRNVRLSEAPSHGLPALIYDLRCPGSEAYLRLARELIGRLPQLAVAA